MLVIVLHCRLVKHNRTKHNDHSSKVPQKCWCKNVKWTVSNCHCLMFGRWKKGQWESYLFWEHGDIFSKWLWATHVSPGHARVSRRAGCQLALLEDKGKEGEQGMPETRKRLLSRYRHEREVCVMAKLVTKGEEGGVEGFLNRHSPLNIFQDVEFFMTKISQSNGSYNFCLLAVVFCV